MDWCENPSKHPRQGLARLVKAGVGGDGEQDYTFATLLSLRYYYHLLLLFVVAIRPRRDLLSSHFIVVVIRCRRRNLLLLLQGHFLPFTHHSREDFPLLAKSKLD